MTNSDEKRVSPEVVEQIWTIKKEVDALQVAAAHEHKPWYKSASAIIAAVAPLISVVSSAGNYYRNINLDQHRLRDELRSIIIRLSSLPLKHLELQEKYSKKPLLLGSISGQINAENMLLASRGVEIIDQISQFVSVSEILAIAIALVPSGEIGKAMPLFETVARKASHASDAVAAYRNLGTYSFQFGKVEQGRKYYSDALEIFEHDRFSNPPQITVNVTHAFTEMYWAQQEAIILNCKGWEQHLEMAEQHAQPFVANREHPVVKQIVETRSYGCPPIKPETQDRQAAPASVR